MHPIKSFAAIIVSLTFVGCSTQAQKQGQQMTDAFAEASNELQQCYTGAKKDYNPEILDNMDSILIMSENDPKAIHKMAIERYMTEPEKAAVLKMSESFVPCQAAFLESISRIHPDLVTYYAKWYAKLDEETLAIIQDKVTIGDYNVTARTSITERTSELQDVKLVLFDILVGS